MVEKFQNEDMREFLVSTLRPAVVSAGGRPSERLVRNMDPLYQPMVEHYAIPGSAAFASACGLWPAGTSLEDDSDVQHACISAKRGAMHGISLGQAAVRLDSEEKTETLLVWDEYAPVSWIWVEEAANQPFIFSDLRRIGPFKYHTLQSRDSLSVVHWVERAGVEGHYSRKLVMRYVFRDGKFVLEAAKFDTSTEGAVSMKGFPERTACRGTEQIIMVDKIDQELGFSGPKTISAKEILFNLLYPQNGKSVFLIEHGGSALGYFAH